MHLTPRSKPSCDPNIGALFDFDRVDMAAGGETLLQLGLADAARSRHMAIVATNYFPSGIILIRPSSRPL